MGRPTREALQAARRLEADTATWQPVLQELTEAKAARNALSKRIDALTDQVRDELARRGGEDARMWLELVAAENDDLKAGNLPESEIHLDELRQAVAGCRLVTAGQVAYLKVIPIKGYPVAPRTDVRVELG